MWTHEVATLKDQATKITRQLHVWMVGTDIAIYIFSQVISWCRAGVHTTRSVEFCKVVQCPLHRSYCIESEFSPKFAVQLTRVSPAVIHAGIWLMKKLKGFLFYIYTISVVLCVYIMCIVLTNQAAFCFSAVSQVIFDEILPYSSYHSYTIS